MDKLNQIKTTNKLKHHKTYLLIAINSVLLLSSLSFANNQSDFIPLNSSQIQAKVDSISQDNNDSFNQPIAYLNNNEEAPSQSNSPATATYVSNSNQNLIINEQNISLDDTDLQLLLNIEDLFDGSFDESDELIVENNLEDEDKQSDFINEPTTESQPSIFQKAYANLFNDGQIPLPKVDASVYVHEDPNNSDSDLVRANNNAQPIKNIRAALNSFTVDSVTDFTAALPRIKQTAKEAAEAVGYYDLELSFTQPKQGKIDVVIKSIGSPVIVENRIFDIRGEKQNFDKFDLLLNQLPLQEGDVFNHQAYSVSKAAVNNISSDYGFFDGKWLNSSADVILPDNIADVNLVYDTAKRYEFDEVVFVTRDPKTGKLTQDPSKLPVNIDLLRQMVNFKINDGYDVNKVTELSNDLFATRYFDGINLDVIMPQKNNDNSGINFENGNTQNNSEIIAVNNNETSQSTQNNEDNILLVDDNKNTAALEFTIDAATIDKLIQVENKADKLYNLPDNQLLATDSIPTNNPIEKIGDALTTVAEQLIPHGNVNGDNKQLELISSTNNELTGKKTPEQTYNTKKVPIYVFVESQNPRDAEIGIGWGTDTGTRIRAKLDQNLINKEGYQTGAEASWSKVKQEVSFYGSRPWKHPLDDVLNANLTYEQEVLNQGDGNFDLNTRSALAGVSRNIINDDGWNRTYSLRFRFDELETGVESTQFDSLPVRFAATGNATQRALLMGYALNKTVADDITDPNYGWRQYYSLEGGADGVVNDTNIVIARAGASGIRSFGESQRHQLIGKLATGYLWSDNFDAVPYQLRFFAGGDQSIRGFDYNSLSPLENSYLTGGEILATASAEYNYEIKKGLRAAVFTDVGNAYDSKFTTDTKVGVGTGIRWLSPIGLIRLDVAAGVSEESIPIRLHFYIGSPL